MPRGISLFTKTPVRNSNISSTRVHIFTTDTIGFGPSVSFCCWRFLPLCVLLRSTHTSRSGVFSKSYDNENVHINPTPTQDLEDLEDCVRELKPEVFPNGFENSIFTGEYLTSTDLIEGDPASIGLGLSGGGSINRVLGDAPGVIDVI